MPAKKRTQVGKKTINRFSIKPLHILIGLGLFVIGGFVIAYSRAATDASLSSASVPVIHLELGSGAQTVEKQNNEPVVSQGPKIIDLSPNGDLSCIENNANSGAGRHLTSAEMTDLVNEVKNAGIISLPSTSSTEVDAKVLRYIDPSSGRIVSINLDAATTSSAAYARALSALERACKTGNKPIKHKDMPVYQLKKPRAMSNPVGQILTSAVGVAQANGGTSTSNPYLDYVNAVDAQLFYRLNTLRAQMGLRALVPESCLRTSASAWTTNMATNYNNGVATYASKTGSSSGYTPYLWHSNPVAALIEPHCGTNWRWIGEIVGYAGINNMQIPATQAADKIFDAYLNSPKHRDVMVYPFATSFNFGTVLTANSQYIFNTGHFITRP